MKTVMFESKDYKRIHVFENDKEAQRWLNHFRKLSETVDGKTAWKQTILDSFYWKK